jgi:hypothetical protein
MWQNIIVFVIVLVCALAIGRRFYRQLKGPAGGCGSGCGSCNSPPVASEKKQPKPPQSAGGCNRSE